MPTNPSKLFIQSIHPFHQCRFATRKVVVCLPILRIFVQQMVVSVLTAPVSAQAWDCKMDVWVIISWNISGSMNHKPLHVAAIRQCNNGRFSGWVGTWARFQDWIIVFVRGNVYAVKVSWLRQKIDLQPAAWRIGNRSRRAKTSATRRPRPTSE